jgi:D-sedoheptulose 7-phosphate isomerase
MIEAGWKCQPKRRLSMSFPDKVYPDAGAYVAAYRDEIARAWQSIDLAAFGRAAALLETAINQGRTIFSCGNGGSASIANHLHCDVLKGAQADTGLRPKVVSLAGPLELLTAIANDFAYAEVFVFPLRTLAAPGDLLITVSSSGNSENIVRAVEWARSNGLKSIAMTGFSGGRSAPIADVNLHVQAENYGIVEDIHQSLMHCLAQHLRQRAMPAGLVPERVF